jgi:predicted RNase H-like nuclease (RuvC/YqgF family)
MTTEEYHAYRERRIGMKEAIEQLIEKLRVECGFGVEGEPVQVFSQEEWQQKTTSQITEHEEELHCLHELLSDLYKRGTELEEKMKTARRHMVA